MLAVYSRHRELASRKTNPQGARQFESICSKLLSHTMKRPHHVPSVSPCALLLVAVLSAVCPVTCAALQHTTALQPADTTPHRTRLFLKDGSYQIVMSYKIV